MRHAGSLVFSVRRIASMRANGDIIARRYLRHTHRGKLGQVFGKAARHRGDREDGDDTGEDGTHAEPVRQPRASRMKIATVIRNEEMPVDTATGVVPKLAAISGIAAE